MQLTPIRTTNGKLIFTLSTGVFYLSPCDFGYHQVLREENLTEDRLRELTVIPLLPDGIFYAYINGDKLYVVNVHNDDAEYFLLENGKLVPVHTTTTHNQITALPIAGVFPSLAELTNYFPHFFI